MESEPQFCQTNNDVVVKLTARIKAGGCAAKISPSQLNEIVAGLPEFSTPNLLTTITSFEDAAVYKIDESIGLVQTIDFFPPVVDDPYLFGRIAAVNALSDVYAMGGKPVLALSVLIFPVCDFPMSVARQIVAGGADTLKEASAALVGGHSIQGPEPIYGLSVTGFVKPNEILRNGGARHGDLLLLTKPIGTGALLLAHKGGILSEASEKTLFNSLTLLNKKALDVVSPFSPHAATDITGFGLIGHLHEMGSASNLSTVLYANKVPLLPDAVSLVEQGLVPAGAYANRNSYSETTSINDDVDLALTDLFFDPQTSGGLLFALSREQASAALAALNKAGLTAAIIGHAESGRAGQVEVRVS